MARKLPVHPITGFTALAMRADGTPLWADAAPHGPLGFAKEPERFELPTELPKTSEELEELRTKAEAAFLAAHDTATNSGAKVPSASDLEELDRLSDAVSTIETAAEEVQAEESERAARADALVAKTVRKTEEAADDAEGDDDNEGDDDAAGDDDTAAGDDDAEGDDDADAKAKEDALVAGAGGKSKRPARKSFRGAGAAGGRKPADQVKDQKHPGFTLNPALRGAKPGHVDTLAIAELSDDIHPGTRTGTANGNDRREVSLATLDRQFPESMILDEDASSAQIEKALSLVTDESRLEGGSLVAAGGWCAPSEVVYDYLGIPNAADLIDLPELGIRRGGIRFPIQPDFGTVFGDKGFLYTEAEAIAQTEDKPCFEVPCDGFDEVRLEAMGLCITAGILQNKGFPELVKTYIDGILNVHQHRISSYTVAKMLAKSTPVTITADTVIAAFDALLNSVELAAIDITTRHRLPYGTTIEIKLPTWARPALRNDLAKRRGVDVQVVTDAQLDAHFANRKVQVQYISDWQTGAVGEPGAATPIVKLPSEVKFLAYPAGTWFRSQANVIEVGNLYDQAQLKKNRYTALFTEDGIAVGKRGIDSRVYTVPLEYTGAVGEALPLAPTP